MKNLLKKEKGITLVALVITISGDFVPLTTSI